MRILSWIFFTIMKYIGFFLYPLLVFTAYEGDAKKTWNQNNLIYSCIVCSLRTVSSDIFNSLVANIFLYWDLYIVTIIFLPTK